MWPMASSIILSVKDYQEEDCQIPNWSFMSFSSKRTKKNPSVFALFVGTVRRFTFNTFKVYTDAYTQLINLNYGGGAILSSSILSALHIQIYCMRNIMQRAKECRCRSFLFLGAKYPFAPLLSNINSKCFSFRFVFSYDIYQSTKLC